VPPKGKDTFCGVIARDANTAGVTDRMLEPVIDPEVALIVVLPWFNAVARPFVLTLAMAGAEEVQDAEFDKSCVLPSLYVPVAVNCWLLPSARDAGFGATEIETRFAAIPVPERLTFCGLFAALSVMESVPVLAPRTEGLKTTEIVQLAPALSLLGVIGQAFADSMKSGMLGVTALIVIALL
jgi:hypothetical protein